jgi:L-asparaginase
MANDKILIINTGGTIGMVNAELGNPLSPLIPAPDWEAISANQPVLRGIPGIDLTVKSFEPLLDSSNIRYENWKEMADVIAANYEDYSGFVILHGTDTMCYTASALSFMLEHLAKPVILTGSQLPMVRPRSDAVQNLITAILIAAAKPLGLPVIPEVCIFFRDYLIRGNRSRKLSSSGYAAFSSPNFPALVTVGEHADANEKLIRRKPAEDQAFFANTFLDTRVMILEIFPGFNPSVLYNIFREDLPEDQQIKGLILKTFGTGNAPDYPEFLNAIEHVALQGTIIVDLTQCTEGMVELGLYEASSGLLNRGVISGVDLTPEAAVCKLMYLMGQKRPKEEIERLMQLNTAGEQSHNIANVHFASKGEASPLFEATQTVPGDVDFSRLTGASIRIHSVTSPKSPIELRLFLNHPRPEQATPEKDPRFAAKMQKEQKNASPIDLFADITQACRRLIKPGQITSLAVVSATGEPVAWEHITLSIHTSAT